MVTGSVSLGYVDAASDVDMMLYYRELPSAETLAGIQSEALASGGGIYAYEPGEGLNLPASFHEEAVRSYLHFPPVAVLQEMGVDREDYGFVYKLIVAAVGNMLNVLCGLNRVIPPGKIKGIEMRVEQMACKPNNLTERMRQLWLLSPQEAIPHLYKMVDDLFDLVDNHMPHISTQTARNRLLLQLRQV